MSGSGIYKNFVFPIKITSQSSMIVVVNPQYYIDCEFVIIVLLLPLRNVSMVSRIFQTLHLSLRRPDDCNKVKCPELLIVKAFKLCFIYNNN